MNSIRKFYFWLKARPFVIIALTVVLVVAFVVYLQTKKPTSVPQIPQETPSGAQPTYLSPPEVFPQSGSAVEFGGTRNAISLFFDAKVDLATIRISSSPNLTFETKTLADFPNRILLQPITPWVPNSTYTITIAKGVSADPGNFELKEDIVLEYTILPPTIPQYDRPI